MCLWIGWLRNFHLRTPVPICTLFVEMPCSRAITRKSTAVDEKIKQLPGGPVTTAYFFDHLATPEDVSVTVMEEDFMEAEGELVPSVRYVVHGILKG